MQTIEQKLEYKRKYNAERAAFLKDLGLCAWCGKEKALENRRLCYQCMMKSSENHSKYWHGLSDEQKKKAYDRRNETNRKRRQKRKENGLCTRCGHKAIPGRSMCPSCTLKNRQQAEAHSQKIGRISFDERGNGTYCFRCCKPVARLGKKLCNGCYEEMVQQAAHMRKHQTQHTPSWVADNQRVFRRGTDNEQEKP